MRAVIFMCGGLMLGTVVIDRMELEFNGRSATLVTKCISYVL